MTEDDEPHSYRSVVDTVHRLAGWQAIRLDAAFRVLLDGRGDPDLMPLHVRKLLCEVLRENGYREKLIIADGSLVGGLMWVRGPWPIDHGALRKATEIETYRPF